MQPTFQFIFLGFELCYSIIFFNISLPSWCREEEASKDRFPLYPMLALLRVNTHCPESSRLFANFDFPSCSRWCLFFRGMIHVQPLHTPQNIAESNSEMTVPKACVCCLKCRPFCAATVLLVQGNVWTQDGAGLQLGLAAQLCLASRAPGNTSSRSELLCSSVELFIFPLTTCYPCLLLSGKKHILWKRPWTSSSQQRQRERVWVHGFISKRMQVYPYSDSIGSRCGW